MKKLTSIKTAKGIKRVKGCKTDSYRCWKKTPSGKKCLARAYLPVGTLNKTEKCPRCGAYSLTLEVYRKKGKTDKDIYKKDKGEVCLCNGTKSRKSPKYVSNPNTDETFILGPHKKGDFGCRFHKSNNIDNLIETSLLNRDSLINEETCPF